MVHEYAYFLRIHLENGLLARNGLKIQSPLGWLETDVVGYDPPAPGEKPPLPKA